MERGTSMNGEQVRRLFFQAMELEPARRVMFVERWDGSPEVQAAVLTLLRHDSPGETFFRQAVSRELPHPVHDGEQFGPYRLCELLGRGGMGAVFKAERIDGEIRQTVAIKVVERGWLDAQAFERFRQERQILSGLVHPNIAQLLDGGTREDDLPYLVMEYVEGLRLDQYCAEHQLGISDRLRVFLPLCAAVEFAHRKLVVHRDLKPSNVLVTADGAPKLLDFGIAKAIDPDAGSRTQTIALTPDFASPEQLLGREVTTATDVYGLGAVLYHLLTDCAPRPVKDLSSGEVERAIYEAGPVRPSALRPELKGDLENILLHALEPQPSSRYGSVRELADDIGRYLERRPVRATPYGWQYRARRFFQRHAAASLAAGFATFAIFAGAGVSIYEARQARHRFDQVRELANHLIFDFEQSIRDVPGTLAARQKMAATARTYLKSLSADAKGSPDLTRELAESYFLLSRIEFNAGQSEAAMRGVETSIALLRSVRDDCCGPPERRLLYIRALADQARYRQDARDLAGARTISSQAVTEAREWLRISPGLDPAQQALMLAVAMDGLIAQGNGNQTQARQLFEESLTVGAGLVRAHPEDEELAYQQARNAYLLSNLGYVQQNGTVARDAARQSREVLDRLLTTHPENGRWQQLRVMALSILSQGERLLADAGDSTMAPQALESAQLAYTYAKVNSERNVGDRNWADQFAVIATMLGIELRANQKLPEALALVREAGTTIDRLVKEEPKRHRFHYLSGNNKVVQADVLITMRRWNDADAMLREALPVLDAAIQEAPSDFYAMETKVSVLADQVIVSHQLGDLSRARAVHRDAMAMVSEMISKDPAVRESITAMSKLQREARSLGLPEVIPTSEGAR
jgi:hypothetical protein